MIVGGGGLLEGVQYVFYDTENTYVSSLPPRYFCTPAATHQQVAAEMKLEKKLIYQLKGRNNYDCNFVV